MKYVRLWAVLGCAIALASPAVAAQAQMQVPRLPAAALAEAPFVTEPKLSPDGMRLLGRMSVEGAKVLGIAQLDGPGLEIVPIPPENELVAFRWAGNGRVLLTMGARFNWSGNGEEYVTRLFVYDLAAGKAQAIGPNSPSTRGDDVLWVDPDGKSLLLSIQLKLTEWPSILSIDLSNNKIKTVQGPREFVFDWHADREGIVRGGIGRRRDSWFLLYRKPGAGDYTTLDRGTYSDKNAPYDAVRVVDANSAYVLSNRKTGRYGVYKFDFASGQLGEPVFESATNDVDNFAIDDSTHEIDAVYYAEDGDKIAWFDPLLKATQVKLDATFRGKSVSIVSRSKDNARMIVWAGDVVDPGAYYLYTPANGQLKRLAKIAANVDRAGLSPMKYVSYSARDGLSISGFLTLPKGREAKGLPLIVMPHGGPYGIRDTLGYDPIVQLLANRGYAVLQPNYRGSGGYGRAFYEKGEGQWGRQMQDDLDDGMDWLVKQGIADAKRVCMVGASYGGYAALWGAARNPERYRCAVSFAGVSDVKSQLSYQKDLMFDRRYRSEWQAQVRGDKAFDLATVSPLSNIAALKVPVMLAHGDKDDRVPLRQSQRYADALTAAGKPHEYYVYRGEGHGFTKAENQKDYFEKLEAFLAKYNPA